MYNCYPYIFSHIDIDECEGNSTACSEIYNTFCVNTIGSFKCVCENGYEEDNDSRNCIGWYIGFAPLTLYVYHSLFKNHLSR